MTSPEPADIALTIGISAYEDPSLASLPQAGQEVGLVREALVKGGFTASDPLLGAIRLAVVREYLASAAKAARRLVIYWTGHGVAGPAGHWLLTSDSRLDSPDPRSAMSAAELAAFLSALRNVTQVVVILDACGSGSTAAEIARTISETRRLRPDARRVPVAIALISSTYDEHSAGPVLFARALASALSSGPPHRTWPAQQARVSPQAVAEAADRWLRVNGAPDAQRVLATGLEAGTGFFANAWYLPGARDVFLDGSAFVRRPWVMNVVEEWLSTAPQGLFLLTGSLGTGKSVVLDQLAQELKDSAPTLVVHVDLAAIPTLRDLLDYLVPRLGLRASLAPADDLVAALAAAGRQATILIDALDEADPADRDLIVRRLILPMSEIAGVHLVVAARGGAAADEVQPEVALLQRGASGQLDLDDDPEAVREITRHIAQVLTRTPASPYRDDPVLVRRLADEVAAASAGVFLKASTVAETLSASAALLAPGDPELRDLLRSSLDDAITQDLARFGARTATAVNVLTALAWTEGPGLAVGDTWVRIARSFSGSAADQITQETITWVISRAGFYITRSAQDGVPAYRLRHQAFGEYLRSRAGIGPAEAHRQIARVLTPSPGTWPDADAYPRRYLASHAERGAVLPGLFSDSDLLIYAEPEGLIGPAARIPALSRPAAVSLYLQAGPLLTTIPPESRAFLLRVLEAEGERSGQRRQVLGFSREVPARILWTTGRSSPHRLVATGSEPMESVTALPVNGRWLVATTPRRPDDNTYIEVHDLDGTEPGQRLHSPHGDRYGVLASVPDPRDPLLICAYVNTVLEAWSMTRQKLLWSRETGQQILHLNVIRSRGEYLVAALGGDFPARAWRAATGEVAGSIGQYGGGSFLLWLPVHERGVLCKGDYSSLEFFDAETFQLLGHIEPEEPWTNAVSASVEGEPMIIGARVDGRLEIRRAGDGRLMSVSREKFDSTHNCSMCVLDSADARPRVVTASGDLITIWSTAPLDRIGYLLGHTGEISGCQAIPTGSGIAPIATAGDDGTVRVWQPASSSHREYRVEHESLFYRDVYAADVAGERVIVADSTFKTDVLKAENGDVRGSFERPFLTTRDHETSRYDIRTVVSYGPDAMVLAEHDGTAQRMWSISTGQQYAIPTRSFTGRVTGVAVAGQGAGLLLVAGGPEDPAMTFDFAGNKVAELAESRGGLPCVPVSFAREPLVVLRFPDHLAVYHARGGARLGHAPSPAGGQGNQSRLVGPLAAGEDQAGFWTVCNGADGGTWLLRLGSGAEPARRLLDGFAVAAAVTIDDRNLVAIGHAARVTLVRPEDGSTVCMLPFHGRIRSMAVTGPGRIVVVAGNRLVHIRVAEHVATS